MSLSVRPAIQSDAASVTALSTEFATYLRSLGDPTDFQLSADTFLRDGFGPNPAFYGLVAEIDNCVIGYLLYHFGYDADLAARNLHMIDLYVTPNSRELGAARALLTQAQITGREAGATTMLWSVFKPNKLARRFYDHLGAELIDDLDHMSLKIQP